MNTKQHPTPSRPALRRAVHLLLLALTFLVGLGGAHAATGTPPDKMTYQGFLADSSGVPLGSPSPANYVTVFRIWSADSGGSNVWSEVQTVTIDKGSFSVVLGDGLPYAAEAHGALSTVFTSGTASDRYLEITVTIAGNPVTIAPRLRLVAAPYALLATTATRLVNPDGTTLLNSPSTGAVNINGDVTATSFIGDGTGLTGVLKEGGTISAATITAGNFTVSNKFTAAKIYSAGAMGVGITNVTRGILEVGGMGYLPYQFKVPSYSFVQPGIGRYFNISTTNVTPTLVELRDNRNNPTNSYWTNVLSGNRYTFSQSLNTNSPYTAQNPAIVRTNNAFGADGILGMDLHFLLAANTIALPTFPAALRGVSVLSGDIGPAGVTVPNPNYQQYLSGSPPYFTTNLYIGSTNFASGNANNQYFNNNVGYLGYYDTGGYYGNNYIPDPIPGNDPASYANGSGYGFAQAGYSGISQPTYFSIFADGPVAATMFYALSDARIKQVAGRSDGSADLGTLMDIEITDYTFKDVLQKGAGKHKKVIAQQVEKIYPQAVTKSTGPVPDIYQQAPVKNGWVYLATDLKAGEKVRLTSEKGDVVYEVLEVRGGSFRVDLAASVEGVFVYGREVNDFRSVDYEALAMLNVSATQELVRQQRELARQVEALRKSEARIAELEQKNSQLSALERKVADLEKLLSQVVAGRKDDRPAVEAPAAKSGNNQ